MAQKAPATSTSPAAPAKKVPRVLVLHGYTQNASIFGKRIGALRKTFGKDIELVIVDAPIVLYPADLVETFGPSADLSSLGAGEASAAAEDPKLTPRGWWKTNQDRTSADGLEDSVAFLRDVLKEKHFDGIFGFSQGAAMAAMLTALLEKPEVHPDFLVGGKPPHPPVDFCIAAAGFKPVGAFAEKVFEGGYSTPTLHIIGRTDIIITAERAQSLIDVSKSARVEEHEGGHFLPSKANWRNFLKAYLLDPLGNIPSPSAAPSGTATPASGTATPAEPAVASTTIAAAEGAPAAQGDVKSSAL
ncbi:unnamed protein product [Peniophora sp. CBMAI 1063]|nr:unnamed protein product [Peniophora sp. CBMAI 1063]